MKHFAEMLSNYEQKNPTWRDSRKNFCQFVFRAHNTVNVRTRKPVYTFRQGIEELQRGFPSDDVINTRRAYLVYIRSDWMRNMTIAGIASFAKLKELNLIESEYWGTKTFDWADLLQFEASTNVSPIGEQLSVLNSTPNIPKMIPPAGGFNLKLSGKLGRLSSLR